jgi:hypothetical protein
MNAWASGVLRISPSRIGPRGCVECRPMFSYAWLTINFIAAASVGPSLVYGRERLRELDALYDASVHAAIRRSGVRLCNGETGAGGIAA